MTIRTGIQGGPLLILHGGAGPADPSTPAVKQATLLLEDIGCRAFALLRPDQPPLAAVAKALEGMEDHPSFNAGYGAALQADGQARCSAAVMDGSRLSFSGVVSVSCLRFPSRLAMHLQQHRSRVLTAPGHELLARQLGEKPESLLVDKRVRRWQQALEEEEVWDTVGCVVRHEDGSLAAGTSTGGRGFEYPGRVSDSPTVAGNYCSDSAAVTATGIGEDIVDDALCARFETRVRDGQDLQTAGRRCYDEALHRKRSYGWIACNEEEWQIAHTTPVMTWACIGAGGRVLASSRPVGEAS